MIRKSLSTKERHNMKETVKIEFTRDQLKDLSKILEVFYRMNMGQHSIAIETCFTGDDSDRKIDMPFDWDTRMRLEKDTNELVFGDRNKQYGIYQASSTARMAAELQDRVDDWLRVTARGGLVHPLEKGIFEMSPIPVPEILDDNYDVVVIKLTEETQNKLEPYRNKKDLIQKDYEKIWEIVDKDANICEYYEKAVPVNSRICSCFTAVEFKRSHIKLNEK
jgi:hypothetical protein